MSKFDEAKEELDISYDCDCDLDVKAKGFKAVLKENKWVVE